MIRIWKIILCLPLFIGSLTYASDLSSDARAERVETKQTKPEKPVSFREWKSQKIHASAEKLRSLKQRLSQVKPGTAGDVLKDVDQDLVQETWRLDSAKDLTIKDYFILYVQPNCSSSANFKFQDVAALLSKDEVATVLENYVQLLLPVQSSKPPGLRVQALSLER